MLDEMESCKVPDFEGEEEFEDFEFRPRGGMPMRRRAPMVARPRIQRRVMRQRVRPHSLKRRPGMQRRRPGMRLRPGAIRMRSRPLVRRPGMRPRPPLPRPTVRPSLRPTPSNIATTRPTLSGLTSLPPRRVTDYGYGYPVPVVPYPFPAPYPSSNGRDHGADAGADLDPNVLVDMGATPGTDVPPDTGRDALPDTNGDFTPNTGAMQEPEPSGDVGADASDAADASADLAPDDDAASNVAVDAQDEFILAGENEPLDSFRQLWQSIPSDLKRDLAQSAVQMWKVRGALLRRLVAVAFTLLTKRNLTPAIALQHAALQLGVPRRTASHSKHKTEDVRIKQYRRRQEQRGYNPQQASPRRYRT